MNFAVRATFTLFVPALMVLTTLPARFLILIATVAVPLFGSASETLYLSVAVRPFTTETAVAEVTGATVSATISNVSVCCASTLPLMSCAQYLSVWVPTPTVPSLAVGKATSALVACRRWC